MVLNLRRSKPSDSQFHSFTGVPLGYPRYKTGWTSEKADRADTATKGIGYLQLQFARGGLNLLQSRARYSAGLMNQLRDGPWGTHAKRRLRTLLFTYASHSAGWSALQTEILERPILRPQPF